MKSLVFVATVVVEFITHQQSALMVADSIQQEDSMERMCEPCRKHLPQMGCEHERQWAREEDLKIKSWKEVLELCDQELIRDYPEGLWVDPAEVELNA
jgi:hypothetical protein